MQRAEETVRKAWSLHSYFFMLVGIFVIIALISSVYIHVSTQNAAAKRAKTNTAYAAQVAAIDAGTQLNGILAAVKSVASTPGLDDVFLHPEKCKLSLTQGHMDIVGPDGAVVCSSLKITNHRNYFNTTWFKSATEGTILVGPIKDAATGRTVVVAATPFPGQNGAIAILYGANNIPNEFSHKYSGGGPLIFAISNPQGVVAQTKQFPKSKFASTVPISNTGWTVTAAISKHDAFKTSRSIQYHEFAISLFGLFAMLLATFITGMQRLSVGFWAIKQGRGSLDGSSTRN